MFSKSKKDKNTYGIIGLGRFGTALALELAESGADLLVIDKDEEKVREMRDYTDNAYVVRSTDKKSLLETGIQNCDVAVICVGEDLDVLLELCDRILVLCGGSISGIVDARTTTKEEIGLLMTKTGKEKKDE